MRFLARLTLAFVIAIPAVAAAQQQPAQQPPGQQPAPQQPAAQQPAQQQAPTITFTASAGVLIQIVKAEKVADFEKFVGLLHTSLAKSEDETRRKQAAGWRVFKVTQADPSGNQIYLFFVDPTVGGADYTTLKIVYDTLPSEGQNAFKLLDGAFVQRSLWNLELLADFSKPPAAAPAQPQP